MDKNRFDGFARQLAQRENRRQAIKTLLAGGAGTAAAVIGGNQAEAAKPGGASDCCPSSAPRLCNLTCTDLNSDPLNCGGCGNQCGAGLTCSNGTCQGATVKCKQATDCPGSDTECQTRTCVGRVCGFSYAASGTPTSNQTPGDCKQNVCDGAGGVTTANDAAGVICPDGVCDGNGNCVECLSPATCPGDDNECQTRACTNGTCGFDFIVAGTPVAEQTLRDCQRNVCDGFGKIISEIDNTDAPLSLDECLTGACDNGVPTFLPAAPGTSCNDGVCDGDGNCVECVSPLHCFEPPNAQATCDNNTCGYSCDPGFANCNGSLADGCETFLSGDMNNCGACGVTCNGLPHVTLALCSGGTCQIVGCEIGWDDCDGNPANGCEVNVFDDSDNCGRCGNVCPGTTQCRTGSCA